MACAYRTLLPYQTPPPPPPPPPRPLPPSFVTAKQTNYHRLVGSNGGRRRLLIEGNDVGVWLGQSGPSAIAQRTAGAGEIEYRQLTTVIGFLVAKHESEVHNVAGRV